MRADAVGENTGDRRLRPRGAGRLGVFARDDGRLETESSVPAFSRSVARTKGGIRVAPYFSGWPRHPSG